MKKPIELASGLYDRVIDESLDGALAQLDEEFSYEKQKIDSAEYAGRIGAYFGGQIESLIAGIKPDARDEFLSNLVSCFDQLQSTSQTVGKLKVPPSLLTGVGKTDPVGRVLLPAAPNAALSDTYLLTNSTNEPSLIREIEAEFSSADRIDMIVAFIRWSGVRDLIPIIKVHISRGRAIRILTTTYTGSTEARALEELVAAGAEVKVSYDTKSTRLHAKAWLFHRESGFSTAYIGSSNLSYSAQVDGQEWNLRVAQSSSDNVVQKFIATFETYWSSYQYMDYEAEQFASAVAEQGVDIDRALSTVVPIRPHPYQARMLEQLRVARANADNCCRSLVVAATGSGKTVVAALDYLQFVESNGASRLLFVVHRKEILTQARDLFRHALSDGSFGELWVDGHKPTRWEHVFASIQTLNQNDILKLGIGHFDVVIVDEIHHAMAKSYSVLFEQLEPKYLLGLTATPERNDGLDVFSYFDGRATVELRLWDALEEGLLCPFHYYAIHDGTDLRCVKWGKAKGYDAAELTDIYTADDIWASKVIVAAKNKITDVLKMKALGFCVSIRHAEFMADYFRKSGITATALSGKSDRIFRDQVVGDFRAGKINIIFSVDIFNEGVDLPDVDTLLMLRPTESATVFLQQLGRGLRKTTNSKLLTVLDFVGQHRADFRFDRKLRAITLSGGKDFKSHVDSDFSRLPSGCKIKLDEISKDIILECLRLAIPSTKNRRVEALREMGDVCLEEYLEATGLRLEEIYRPKVSWATLRHLAGLDSEPQGSLQDRLSSGVSRILHCDDTLRIETWSGWLSQSSFPKLVTTRDSRLLNMLLLLLFSPASGEFPDEQGAWESLQSHPGIIKELLEVLTIAKMKLDREQYPATGDKNNPLRSNALYSRMEVIAALGQCGVSKPLNVREGVYWDRENTDVFFVTLNKSEKYFSPSTSYRDYAISEKEFHWESQSTTSVLSKTGQRYINQKTNGNSVVLLVRSNTKTADGHTESFRCLGECEYVWHEGTKPITIVWRFRRPLTGDVFSAFRAVV